MRPDGSFTLEQVQLGDVVARALLPAQDVEARAHAELTADSRRAHVVLVFDLDAPELLGRVLFEGQPVAGVVVNLDGQDGSPKRSSRTDSDGRFRFRELDQGAYVVSSSNGGQSLSTPPIVLEGTRHVTIHLDRHGTVRIE